FIALVYIATTINIQLGPTSGGLFHLGNVMSFTIAMVFGKKAGAISGGIGMALYDILSPYAIWAPFTLIIRVIMGLGGCRKHGCNEKRR
ncbi:ECF transporter S component, partial [Clostridium saudiense]|nr:ECF transporter S component [Clostridium saudiense]